MERKLKKMRGNMKHKMEYLLKCSSQTDIILTEENKDLKSFCNKEIEELLNKISYKSALPLCSSCKSFSKYNKKNILCSLCKK